MTVGITKHGEGQVLREEKAEPKTAAETKQAEREAALEQENREADK